VLSFYSVFEGVWKRGGKGIYYAWEFFLWGVGAVIFLHGVMQPAPLSSLSLAFFPYRTLTTHSQSYHYPLKGITADDSFILQSVILLLFISFHS